MLSSLTNEARQGTAVRNAVEEGSDEKGSDEDSSDEESSDDSEDEGMDDAAPAAGAAKENPFTHRMNGIRFTVVYTATRPVTFRAAYRDPSGRQYPVPGHATNEKFQIDGAKLEFLRPGLGIRTRRPAGFWSLYVTGFQAMTAVDKPRAVVTAIRRKMDQAFPG